jgi:GNAT superfamily N-acetyltransferase
MKRIKLFEEYVDKDFKREIPGIGMVKFHSGSRDYHSGQSYMTTAAYDSDGNCVGWCDWSEYENEISIDMLEVPEKYRRKGIATMIMDVIRAENPGIKIDHGYGSEDGSKWLKAYQSKDRVPTIK